MGPPDRERPAAPPAPTDLAETVSAENQNSSANLAEPDVAAKPPQLDFFPEGRSAATNVVKLQVARSNATKRTAAEILHKLGFKTSSDAPGHHYSTCPKCSPLRKQAHQQSPVLGITINNEGVAWTCNHCGYKGGERYIVGYTRNDDSKFIAIYSYFDEQGTLLFQVCRKADKTFPQRKSDGRGGWVYKTQGIRKVLYRLPELIEDLAAGHPIVTVEGEKDANSLRNIGIAATCSPGGASEQGKKPKWRPEYSETLRGADIIIMFDNDPSGRAHAEATATMSLGIAKRIRILDLAKHWPDMPKGADVSDWLALGHTREELDSLIDNAPDFREQDEAQKPKLALPFVDMSNWDRTPTPQREWAVLNRIPLRQPTLFSGHGGIGKSTVELQLCVAHVLGRDWFGSLPEPGPAIYLGAEEEPDELRRRLTAIAGHYGVSFADLIKGGLHLLSFAGEDAVLAVPDGQGKINSTPLFQMLMEAGRDIRPKHIGIDTRADVFGGNEIDRSQVRQFVGTLRKLAITADCAVVLSDHPSLTGINSGSGLSGSTGWHNSVRAQIYMKKLTPEGEEPDSELLELQFLKNQYGPKSERVLLRWRNGLFLPEQGANSVERSGPDAAEKLFFELLIRFNAQNRNVNASKGISYAPAAFAKESEAKAANIRNEALADAMRRLFATDRIHLEAYGRPSRQNFRLVPGPGRPVEEARAARVQHA